MLETGAGLITAERGPAGDGYFSLSLPARAMNRDGARALGITIHRNREAEVARFRETFGTTAFTYAADVIDRSFLNGYLTAPVATTYEILGRRRNTTDLARQGDAGSAQQHSFSQGRLVERVQAGAEYLPVGFDQELFSLRTYKYGQTMPFTFEAWLRSNRDIGFSVQQFPDSWGLSARYTQEYRFTEAWAGQYGLGTEFFNDTDGNYTTTEGAFDADSLETGITAIRGFADPSGNIAPYMGKLFLVVPPALEVAAKTVVNSQFVVGDTDRGQNNPMFGAATVIVNYYLPAIDTTNGDTAWYLFCDPAIRPAVRYGGLEGYEAPEIYIRAADAQLLGAALADPTAGSFATDSIEYKLRMFWGADVLDWRGAYCDDGTAA